MTAEPARPPRRRPLVFLLIALGAGVGALALSLLIAAFLHKSELFLPVILGSLLYAAAYPVYRAVRWGLRRRAQAAVSAKSFAIWNWAWLVCVVILLTPPMLVTAPALRARLAKAEADTRFVVSAVGTYRQHTGRLPAALTDLTITATNPQGQTAGPFLLAVPHPPAAWTEYRYELGADGTYTITATGDGHTIIGSPEGVSRR